jgi:hypothetical protein
MIGNLTKPRGNVQPDTQWTQIGEQVQAEIVNQGKLASSRNEYRTKTITT